MRDQEVQSNSVINSSTCMALRSKASHHSTMSLPKIHLQNATNASCPDLRGQGYSASFHSHSAARGPRKKIYHGHLDGKGPRKGEHAVVKVFRDKPGTETLCDEEIEKHKLARKLAARFNKLIADERSQIHFTLPLKSTVDSISLGTYLTRHTVRGLGKKEWVLIEENLLQKSEYQVFIRKNGERLNHEPTSLDAFMHFTYHESEGLFLMCGFQGIHTSSGYTLTTPCLHSVDHSFGHTIDKGHKGIKMTFKHHQCNNICYSFLKPDPSKMTKVSSESEGEEKEEEDEEEEEDQFHTTDIKENPTKPEKERKINRTKKMRDTGDFGIPKEAPCQLPRRESDPADNVDVHFPKSVSLGDDLSSGKKESAKRKEKTKKKKNHYRSNVKVLTTILRKRPSF